MADRAAALQSYTAKLLKTREETGLRKKKLEIELENLKIEANILDNKIEDLEATLTIHKAEKKEQIADLEKLIDRLNDFDIALSKIVESAQVMSQITEKTYSA